MSEKIIPKRVPNSEVDLTKEDFKSDQIIKWCPGCGNTAVLKAVEDAFPEIGYKKENFLFVSGIGCSSRFPYYINTYGIHGIHGRAAAIASGVKIANPSLSVWVATGDGDAMAIGGNHFIHTIRRNIDINILLFNNQVYALTKGQYSPTTPKSGVTRTSPHGTIEHPFNPAGLVMGAMGTFFARVIDNDVKMMKEVIKESAYHDGTAVVEILQRCVIYSDDAFDILRDKNYKEDYRVYLKHGEPMLFGKDNSKGIIFEDNKLKQINVGEDKEADKKILIHDQYNPDPGIHRMLGYMHPPEMPRAFGVIRAARFDTYEHLIDKQINNVRESTNVRNMDDLLNSGDTFEIS